MNHPYLYQKANEVQRHDAEEIIKEYSHKLQWRNDGCDALLDVGCASGDVLIDFIYTIMPEKFARIVGTDISPKMINYARNVYRSYEKCDFRVLDIGTEKDLPSDLKEQFDHVTSQYCLHWVRNKRQALRNIFKMLRPEGGDCLLVFLASHPICDVYNLLSKSNKWSPYMKDVDQLIDNMNYSKDPKLELFTLLKEVGFSDIEIDVKYRVYAYEGKENFKESFKAVNPFMDRIPISLHDSYMDDFIDIVNHLNIRQDHQSKKAECIFKFSYNLIVAYAKKCPNEGGDRYD